MENLLKTEFVSVINKIRVGTAPQWNKSPEVRHEDISDGQFDVVDSKEDSTTIRRPFQEGTASYINPKPYDLRFIAFDDYLHQFTYDDGKGNTHKSMLPPHTKMADLLVYSLVDKDYFLVQELCVGSVANKRAIAKIQLSNTLNLLYQSPDAKEFIDSFKNKICYLSANDGRVATPNQVAEGFMNSYNIIPDPAPFTFGKIKTCGFSAYETSIVKLK
ncbi:MAG: hypothetical protein J5554_12175 [Paludibacteraceae bacterium]|nr:hypothetical protein [Paludibacteraceae bacterium]